MKNTAIHHLENDRGASVFKRVLVGVDGGEAGFEACRQAARLADPDAPIDVIAVVHVSEQARAIYDDAEVADKLQEAADSALATAVALVGARARPRCVDGLVTEALIREVKAGGGTLLALGTHGHRRIGEILVGGVAGELLHTAPCAVLIARPPAVPERFPASIVVGLDGSACADHAYQAAEEVAARSGAPLRAIAATQSKDVELERVFESHPGAEKIDARPVDALVTASCGADLLVVGSRGLRGIRALGSVSERVAHQASSSVLVVRWRGGVTETIHGA